MEKERLNHEVFHCSETAQIIQVAIDPGHTITAGIIFNKWFDDGINFEKKANRTGSLNKRGIGKLLDSGIKKLGRAGHQVICFTNSTRVKKSIAFAAPSTRRIMSIQVSEQEGNFFCHKDAFICAESGLELLFDSGSRSKSNIKGVGKSDWLEFHGNGTLFAHVGGKFKKKHFKKQALKLDQRSIVGFTGGIGYDRVDANLSRLNRSDLKAYFRVRMAGSGTVYLQSKPFRMPKQAQRLTRDITELVNNKAVKLYDDNKEKIKNFQWSKLQDLARKEKMPWSKLQDLVRKENLQWSKLQDLVKKENLQNTLKTKIDFRSRLKKLTAKKS